MFFFLTDQKQLKLEMVSAVANGYENTVSLISFIDPPSLRVHDFL